MRNLILRPDRISRDMDKVFQAFFGNPNCVVNHQGDFAPRVDIVEDDDQLRLTFEVPGMEKGDIKVVVADSKLTVSGEKKVSREIKDENRVRSEINTGSFSRSFSLPDSVNAEKVAADYKNGMLEVSLPKKEERKPKEIEIKVQ